MTDEPSSGGLGDEATQRAWMKYAENQDIPHDHEDETVFKDGYHAGRENLESLEAQLAQAEDACYQMQTELSSQLVSTQKALKGLYNAVQRSRSVNDPLGKATAMEEAGRWYLGENMSKQSPQKVLDRILNYPHAELFQ